jgi:hypothetical protein
MIDEKGLVVLKRTLIISAFPGTGKTTLFDAIESLTKDALNPEMSEKIPLVVDSDSSKFSWLESGVRDPDFPNNYIKHIKGLIGHVDLIMVSTHKVVRDALKDAGIRFVIVHPIKLIKEEYIERYVQRGSPEGFIKLMDEKWNEFISELHDETEVNKIALAERQTLTYIINMQNSPPIEGWLSTGYN